MAMDSEQEAVQAHDEGSRVHSVKTVSGTNAEKYRLPLRSPDLYAKYDAFIRRAVDVFGNAEAAREWLDTPQEDFLNKTPLDYAAENGFNTSSIEPYFIRIEHGIYR